MREKILEILAETAGVPVSDLHDDTRLIQCIENIPGSASLPGIFLLVRPCRGIVVFSGRACYNPFRKQQQHMQCEKEKMVCTIRSL